MPFSPDQIIGEKYQLKRHLARGGMGAVWRAHHLDLGIDVAIKVLRSDVVGDEMAAARFRREARAAAQLKSPHVVHVHDYGVHGDVPYLVMELLEGEDLDEYLEREGPLPLEQAVSLIEEACEGLTLVHEKGIVHRDIKPSNLFLARQGSKVLVKLLDFGIAKATVSEDGETTQGLVLGSPAYMSPEHARGGTIDARSDLWSLAGVLYRMVTGVVPFDGANSSDIVVKLCTEDVAPPSSHLSEADPALDAFFRRAFSRDPQQRPESARAFAVAVRGLMGESFRAPSAPDGDRVSSTSAASRPSGRVDETAPLSASAPAEESSPGSVPPTESKRSSGSEDGGANAPAHRFPRALLVALIAGGLLVAVLMWRASHPDVKIPATPDASLAPAATPPQAPAQTSPTASETTKAKADREPTDDAERNAEELPRAQQSTSEQTATDRTPPRKAGQPAPAPVPRPSSNPERDPVFGLPVQSP